MTPTVPGCSVHGCAAPAVYATYLRDDLPYHGHFHAPDTRCPFLCHAHAVENEEGAQGGVRADGSPIRYPCTKGSTTGYTRYKRLATGRFLRQNGVGAFTALQR